MPKIIDIQREIDEYLEVLMGHQEPPIRNGVMTMMEVANAYYARAMELTILIHRGESDGIITKTHPYYKLRNGELRKFAELAKSCVELGSRRLTASQIEYQATLG